MASKVSSISAIGGPRASITPGSTMAKTLPPTPKKPFTNIRKVAVLMPDSREAAQLIELDQNQHLDSIIQEICEKWHLEDSKSYSLRFNEQNQKMYITEKNRKDIRDGQVLNLTPSAFLTAKIIKAALSGEQLTDKTEALRKLTFLSSDITFAEEFVKINGHIFLIENITSGKFKGDPLTNTLQSFVLIMDHNIFSWDILEAEFIKRVADCVNISAITDTACLQFALDILKSIVLNCSTKQNVIEQTVTPVNVTPHLESKSPDVQKNAIALINALFSKADDLKRKKIAESLQTQRMRNNILSNVIRGGQNVSAGMAHELYVLQTLLLNLNEERMRKSVDVHDSTILREIDELRRIAFDVEGDPNINTVRKTQNSAQDYKKMGFENINNPIEDFVATPPGVLALDVMLYFARNHGESYMKVIVENSTRQDDHDCPFVQASKMLTKILCDILKIGEIPTEDSETYYSMFFTHDKPFEEFFCICIQLLNKTWREMKATSHDFQKVLDVVREQIVRVLNEFPTSLETFRTKINALTYAKINKLWENERIIKEGQGAQLKPIIELRDRIKPEIMELIKQQRIKFLMTGTKFAKFSKNVKVREKFWYWRLAPNQKALLYGDCEENQTPQLEELPNKLPLSDIQKVLTGKDCAHITAVRNRKVTTYNLAFSFKCEPDTDPFCFMAGSENEFDMWTDGVNCLIGAEMTSAQVAKDLETLLSMEIRMRMLDTEGVTIPAEAPPIPAPPTNYNFAYLNL